MLLLFAGLVVWTRKQAGVAEPDSLEPAAPWRRQRLKLEHVRWTLLLCTSLPENKIPSLTSAQIDVEA